jgi:hypothetical protein
MKPHSGDILAAVVYDITNRDPPPLDGLGLNLPAGLSGIVAKGLSRERDGRYATVEEFAQELETFDAPWAKSPHVVASRIGAQSLDTTLESAASSSPEFAPTDGTEPAGEAIGPYEPAMNERVNGRDASKAEDIAFSPTFAASSQKLEPPATPSSGTAPTMGDSLVPSTHDQNKQSAATTVHSIVALLAGPYRIKLLVAFAAMALILIVGEFGAVISKGNGNQAAGSTGEQLFIKSPSVVLTSETLARQAAESSASNPIQETVVSVTADVGLDAGLGEPEPAATSPSPKPIASSGHISSKPKKVVAPGGVPVIQTGGTREGREKNAK